MQSKDNVGVAFAGTTIQYSDVPLCRSPINVPFAIESEVVCADFIRCVGDVHFGGVIRVGSNQEWAMLGVEGEIGDINITGSPEYSPWLPM